MEKLLKTWETAALAALSVTLLLGAWAQGRQESISGSLIRLHVIAVSDEEYEQELKLRVRDAVLEYLAPKFENVSTKNEAHELIEASLDGIRGAAESASEGHEVTVMLGREAYPVRAYEGFTLPAGEYESLRVTLGEGEGRNWWCVVFPPICLSAAESKKIAPAMSTEDIALVTGADGYEFRFRIVELWGETLNRLHGVSFSAAQRDEGILTVGGHGGEVEA